MTRLFGVLVVLLISTLVLIESKPKVRFVSVVFRHGDRAPEHNGRELYPKDPYLKSKFLPGGPGALNKNGKRREKELGKFLRKRYKGLLGKYDWKDVDAQSTNYPRTIMSLKLVLEGLYAKKHHWKRRLGDGTMTIPKKSRRYKRYWKERRRILKWKNVKKKINGLKPSMKKLTKLTGKKIKTPNDMAYLYHTLSAERSMGLKLPKWTKKYFPKGKLLHGIALDYHLANYNNFLKKLNVGGSILKRIYNDMHAHVKGHKKKARKMNLFSGHEVTVAAFLKTLGIYKTHVPAYSSAVIVELLKKGKKNYVKVLYYHGIPKTAKIMKIPGCRKICPLDKFKRLLRKVIPTNKDLGHKKERKQKKRKQKKQKQKKQKQKKRKH